MFNESLSQVAVMGSREWVYHAACTQSPSALTFKSKYAFLKKYILTICCFIFGHVA